MNITVKVKNSDYYPKTLKLKWLLATRRFWLGLIADVILGVFFEFNLLPFKKQYNYYVGSAILFIIAFIIFILLRNGYKYLSMGNKWLKLNKDANTDIELNFTDSAIFFKDYRGTTTLDWNKFKRYQRFIGYLFIMDKHPGDAVAFQESLVSKEEMNELLQFMHNRFTPKK
jgi:hypothetical protein